LTTIRVDDIEPYNMNSNPPSSMLTTIQCALTSPHLRELVFSLLSYHEVYLDNLQWDEIDKTLSSTQLDSLKKVEFCVDGWSVLDDAREAVTERLPQSCARHTVVFTPS
jgi:hypothetical protein